MRSSNVHVNLCIRGCVGARNNMSLRGRLRRIRDGMRVRESLHASRHHVAMGFRVIAGVTSARGPVSRGTCHSDVACRRAVGRLASAAYALCLDLHHASTGW